MNITDPVKQEDKEFITSPPDVAQGGFLQTFAYQHESFIFNLLYFPTKREYVRAAGS